VLVGKLTWRNSEADTWDVSSLDYERNGGVIIRFDLKNMMTEWLLDPARNHGVVIITRSLSQSALNAVVTRPTLTVRIGSRPEALWAE
jgi:hypothetical protein